MIDIDIRSRSRDRKRSKFMDAFKVRNKAKLWFSANEIPESEDNSDAFYRRWMIFHLDKQYLYGKEDVNLFKKLTTPVELSGLLNIALVGLSRLVHDRTIDDIRRDYEIHTNDVNAFLHEGCIVDIRNRDTCN
jgi:putative DNA primase/helicase